MRSKAWLMKGEPCLVRELSFLIHRQKPGDTCENRYWGVWGTGQET